MHGFKLNRFECGDSQVGTESMEKTRDFFGASSTGMFLETQIPGLVWVYFFLHIPSYKVYVKLLYK